MAEFNPYIPPPEPGRVALAPLTAKQVFTGALYELNKVRAANFRVEDYNYFINRAVISYVQKRYNLYDSSQQTTDDLRGLSTTVRLDATTTPSLDVTRQVANLPADYQHLLGAYANFKVLTTFEAYTAGQLINFGTKRLTADMAVAIQNDYFQKPKYNRPYHFIRDGYIEVRSGLHSRLRLDSVILDYIQTPRVVLLTQAQLDDDTLDTSQTMEFPAYAGHEIIKELVTMFLENTQDPRLQSFIPINQNVPNQPPAPAGMAPAPAAR